MSKPNRIPIPYSAELNNHCENSCFGCLDGVSQDEFAELERLFPNAFYYLENLTYDRFNNENFDDDGEWLITSPIRSVLHSAIGYWHSAQVVLPSKPDEEFLGNNSIEEFTEQPVKVGAKFWPEDCFYGWAHAQQVPFTPEQIIAKLTEEFFENNSEPHEVPQIWSRNDTDVQIYPSSRIWIRIDWL